jgi:tRNA (uracil-5-)-methyltransferase TRM9
MNKATVRRLNAINERFYRRFAAGFYAARQAPRSGWERVLVNTDLAGAASILDAGCGNARFALFSEQHFRSSPEYWGVDASSELLMAAGSWGNADWHLIHSDFVLEDLPPPVLERQFDLVVCFGVMHHIPGEAVRRHLVERLAARVAPGGQLAISFWQFGAADRFARRVQAWDDFNRSESSPVELDQLEPGDHLLYWGDLPDVQEERSGSRSRYCHYADPVEVERLMGGLPLDEVDAFAADGRSGDLNLYRVLARPAG